VKATFNGKCSSCGQIKPRCARINFRVRGNEFQDGTTPLCQECRKRWKGQYRLAAEHRVSNDKG
jgi:hypothetical protein